MTTHQALFLSSTTTPPTLQKLPKPTATAGTAIVRVLAVTVVPYMNEILSGVRPYPLSFPLIPGGTAIARIDSVGPDSVSLKPGQLVFCDVTIRARDDPDVQILLGIHGGGYPAAQRLMDGEWRNATWAEFAKFPLENLYAINENVVCNDLGYSVEELTTLAICAVPFGGLSAVRVGPGDSVIIAPATGYYGGAAVTVAMAMGCRVIAAGRNKARLDALATVYGETGRLISVLLTGDEETDSAALKSATRSPKGADAYIDFSPPQAGKSTHIVAALGALRPKGNAVFMGGIPGRIEIPYSMLMFKNLTIQGRFMFERKDVEKLIRYVENGILQLGQDIGMMNFRSFGLKEWENAVNAAKEQKGWGSQVLLRP
ncbi:hypothetical protein D0Z07_7783 [Hyphodiscus hymeniophilus]|uniref:Alcohol dehydrogenase-like C-terminal domain-containing protein n=1 Tax=Hyphodiscus hymeniophilus TaxID=353542 RepID=A0A9P6SM43_9HELO|nr:hypothetical protein D0Z07_7783 [Hyphodiscus hymeniophilus]